MTLNLFFITITIQIRRMSHKEAAHPEMVEKLYEKNKDRQAQMYRNM